jgi:hypothetical protein
LKDKDMVSRNLFLKYADRRQNTLSPVLHVILFLESPQAACLCR